ncbi:hypothetical protein DNTS_026802 [Danionella cerebrum]|uniref:protein-tyrosine-phosphatase n=1 Tax=Danionella cerebrum TaxID=2873325 RepID=A0A553QQ37_9TELE|nr:hypothetical protein DNTS_026802 [Danionella translucida]
MMRTTVLHFAIWSACGILTSMMVDSKECSIDVLKTVSTTDSVQATLESKDVGCQYFISVMEKHNDSKPCLQVREPVSRAECQIDNLDPGRWYHLDIRSMLEEKQQSQFTVSLPTRPSAVGNLLVSGDSNSLVVSWQPGEGFTERYWIVLMDASGFIWNSTVSSSETSCTITDLIPGRLYNITVYTEVGEHQNSLSTQAQTAPASVSNVRVENNAQENTIRVLWDQASGDADSYLVTLTAPDLSSSVKVLSPDGTDVLFENLDAGRIYQVSISTRSGALFNTTRITARTAPGQVSGVVMKYLFDSGELKIYWTPSTGESLRTRVLLSNSSEILRNQTAEGSAKEMRLSGLNLSPGRVYGVAISVEDGDLVNTVHFQGKLGSPPVSDLHIRYADETSISAQWAHTSASSDRDGYTIELSETNTTAVLQTRTLNRDMRECTFNVLIPGRLYDITVTAVSKNIQSSTTIQGRTVPLKVSHLKLSNQGSTNSLKASWETPLGDLDVYRLLLLRDKLAVINISVPANTSSILLPSLRAGALHTLLLTALSGSQSSKAAEAQCRTVPAAASDITITDSGPDFLNVSWKPADGDVDNYVVILKDQEKIIHTLTTSKANTECVFRSLVSGRLYSVSISTHSGSFRNQTLLQHRTQPSPVQKPSAVHSARDDFLKVYWNHASGDYDYYEVAIEHNGTRLQSQKLSRTQSECVFSDLVPGRLYNVNIRTWSGAYDAAISIRGRTFPGAVGNLSLGESGSRFLQVNWTSAPGDVDHYEVQILFNDTQESPAVNLSSSARGFLFSELTPGRLYKMVVSTHSGSFQRAQILKGRTVPSQVQDASLMPGTTESSLRASWSPGEGDMDFYTVSLYQGNQLQEKRHVQKQVMHAEFQRLVPGQLYQLSVQTFKPSPVLGLHAEEGQSTDTLSVSWSPALGVFHGYALQLFDEKEQMIENTSVPAVSNRYQFHNLTAGERHTVHIQTLSGSARSKDVTAHAQTSPAPVSGLHVCSNSSTMLSFCWSPAEGKVEGYGLYLYDPDETLQSQKTLGDDSLSCVFSHLQPGTLYEMKIFSSRGKLRNQATMWARTAPATVSDLRVESPAQMIDSLLLRWTRAPGALSGYVISVGGMEQHLGPEVTQTVFQTLVPGRLYLATVQSCSEDLRSSTSAAGRTGQSFGDMNWLAPVTGDYEDFHLTWSPPDTLHISRLSLTARLLEGLHSGRLYNFSLRTVSGTRSPPVAYSRALHHTIRMPPFPTPGLHCFPLSSSSVSCSWKPPDSDYDSFILECYKKGSRTPVYTHTLGNSTLSQQFDRLEPFRNYSISITVKSGDKQSSSARSSVITMIDRPPVPPASVRVNERSAVLTHYSIQFQFNCSWFSDANGAIRYFTIIVTESNDVENLFPEQRHPLPSYLEYRQNSSIRAYQTGYLLSRCSEQSTSKIQVLEINLGAGMRRLGGACNDPESIQQRKHLCDGPLKPRTAYRISVRAFTQLFDEEDREVQRPLYSDTYLSLPLKTQSAPRNGLTGAVTAATFLMSMVLAVTAILLYRKRAHKIAVQESPVTKICMWKALPNTQMCLGIKR